MLLPPALLRRERFPRGRDLYVGVASGVVLGAHFGFWIFWLDHTSVAASVVLVSTQPMFVVILAYRLFRERTSPLSFAGILAALAGTAVIAGDDSVGSAFLGNALAFVGVVTVAVYVLIGRSSRTGGIRSCPTRWWRTPPPRTRSSRWRSFWTPTLGVLRRDLVLALDHHARASDHGLHHLQLGVALRRGVGNIQHRSSPSRSSPRCWPG